MKQKISVLATIIVSISAMSANASPLPPIEQYKAIIARAQRTVDMAEIAVICDLRSQEWFSAFADAYQAVATGEAQRLGVGQAGLDAADAMVEQTARKARAETSCRNLLNSATMDHLDQVHRRLTGGYH